MAGVGEKESLMSYKFPLGGVNPAQTSHNYAQFLQYIGRGVYFGADAFDGLFCISEHAKAKEGDGAKDNAEVVVEWDVVEALVSSEVVETCVEDALDEVGVEDLFYHFFVIVFRLYFCLN